MNLDKAKVERFITAALKYKGDKYSQLKRLEPGFSDCSSLIWKALKDSGFLFNADTQVTTYRMGKTGDPRFRLMKMSDLRRGDILWGEDGGDKYSGHVAIYLGEGKTLEARVKEGVDFNKNRKYFTRVYRIKALEEDAHSVSKPSVIPKAKAIENVDIYIHGKLLPVKGYIIDGTTFLEVNGSTVVVRKFFEGLKLKVDYKNGKVYIG